MEERGLRPAGNDRRGGFWPLLLIIGGFATLQKKFLNIDRGNNEKARLETLEVEGMDVRRLFPNEGGVRESFRRRGRVPICRSSFFYSLPMKMWFLQTAPNASGGMSAAGPGKSGGQFRPAKSVSLRHKLKRRK